MKNAEKNRIQLTQEPSKVLTMEIVEVIEKFEIFRAIAQEYFIDGSDKEVDTIAWNLSIEESKWKYDEEDTKNTKQEIAITWAEDNEYQDSLLSNNDPESELQLMNIDEAYLINITNGMKLLKDWSLKKTSLSLKIMTLTTLIKIGMSLTKITCSRFQRLVTIDE
ncbi:22649_t:CDS:2 [Dentiscutata erythropus]|uniref:22649_t:CDS:1 n=1 Tax=Dentiscutata erythropus TaxID=1348616 RepID=A0A9N9BYS6_9GLOM|nr:22649_t:CDS:2 [Dentiscutata erythropus]